jgi:hypothetical protein
MINKEFVNLLTGISMKSEIEVIFDGQILHVMKVGRHHIPEREDEKGRVIPARNIVQIMVKKAD